MPPEEVERSCSSRDDAFWAELGRIHFLVRFAEKNLIVYVGYVFGIKYSHYRVHSLGGKVFTYDMESINHRQLQKGKKTCIITHTVYIENFGLGSKNFIMILYKSSKFPSRIVLMYPLKSLLHFWQ